MAVSQADNTTPPTAPDYATEMQADRERRIYAAACLDDEPVDEQTAVLVRWIASWDQHTVGGLVALLTAASSHPQGREHTEACRNGLQRVLSQMAARGVESEPTEEDVQRWIVAVGHAVDLLDRMLLCPRPRMPGVDQ